MMKYRLVTPGPAMVPEESLLELARREWAIGSTPPATRRVA